MENRKKGLPTLMPTSLFEGPEKKLEIILNRPLASIRDNRDGRWDRVVAASRAVILSHVATDRMDAYLLSESSLFVWDDRILMITCGRTTLARALPEILRILAPDDIGFLFYEQKNFLFPHEQPSSFREDMELVTRHFPGKYYTLGPLNHDHVNVFHSHANARRPSEDATFQVLMHQLSPEIMDIFRAAGPITPDDINQRTGLADLYPGPMIMDGHIFTPCGYSLNGIREGDYFTVHVTPQKEGSYVSFESNILETDFSRPLHRVVSRFRPGRFSVVLTTSLDEACLATHDTVAVPPPGYVIADYTWYEFDCGYAVTFLNFLHRKGLNP